MPRRIAITGPESSGKTTLASQLAAYYNCSWVPEFARTYLEELNRPYTMGDLSTIARGQLDLNNKYSEDSAQIIFHDTDMTVMKIWSEVRFGHCDNFIAEAFEREQNDLTLLCRPDIPWQPDPLRENRNDRHELFKRYHEALIQKKAPYLIIDGDSGSRMNSAVAEINRMLKLGSDKQ